MNDKKSIVKIKGEKTWLSTLYCLEIQIQKDKASYKNLKGKDIFKIEKKPRPVKWVLNMLKLPNGI